MLVPNCKFYSSVPNGIWNAINAFHHSARSVKQWKIGKMGNNLSNFWTSSIFLNPAVKRLKLKVLKVSLMANSVATTWQNSIFHSLWTHISILSVPKPNPFPGPSQNCLSPPTNRNHALLLLHFPRSIIILKEILALSLKIILNNIPKTFLKMVFITWMISPSRAILNLVQVSL